MRVAALQTDIAWEDPEANFEGLRARLAEAKTAGASMILLPEMFACGFSMNTATVAEPPDGPSTQFLAAQAATLDVWVGGSIPVRERRGERPFNAFTLAGPGGEIYRYRKIHPFTFAGEREHYAAGDEILTFCVGDLGVTPFICYDLRFADEFWACAAETDLYVVVANWPESRSRHWRILLRARAIENQAYVVGVNRVGRGGARGEVAYGGDSVIVDPRGEVLAEASRDPALLLAEIDPGCVEEARRTFPVLDDRRSRGRPEA